MSLAIRRPSRPFLPVRLITAVMSGDARVRGRRGRHRQATCSARRPRRRSSAARTCGPAASTSARAKALIPAGTKVSVVATVTGGSYRTSCLGSIRLGQVVVSDHGHQRQERQSLYGVSYVYGATSLFKPTPYTRYAACTTSLRTRPSTSATAKRQIAVNAKVLVATTVTGSAWSKNCGGRVGLRDLLVSDQQRSTGGRSGPSTGSRPSTRRPASSRRRSAPRPPTTPEHDHDRKHGHGLIDPGPADGAGR